MLQLNEMEIFAFVNQVEPYETVIFVGQKNVASWQFHDSSWKLDFSPTFIEYLLCAELIRLTKPLLPGGVGTVCEEALAQGGCSKKQLLRDPSRLLLDRGEAGRPTIHAAVPKSSAFFLL